jgi:hypothetical protein
MVYTWNAMSTDVVQFFPSKQTAFGVLLSAPEVDLVNVIVIENI